MGKILVVDDDATFRYAVNRILSRAGYVVLEAASAEQALERLAERPDLAVIEERLVEVCERLRELPRTARVPVIQLSAQLVDPMSRERALQLGADAYLAKPVSPLALVAAVNALLRMKRAEQVASVSVTQWQATFDAIHDGVRVLDAEGRVARSNCEMDELLKRHGPALEVSTLFPRVRTTRKREATELRAGERWFRVTGDPIIDERGAVIGAVEIYADISDRKRSEAEIQRALALEQAARAEAEAASRAKDEFVATVSHELRTPLTAILGWVQLLRRGAVDESRRGRAIETIERNVKSQARLIEDLLDVSRMVTGKLRLETTTLAMGPLVEAAAEAIRPLAAAKGVCTRAHVAADMAPIVGDPTRLQQVVSNLLSNAVKFTPGGGNVDVRLQPAGGGVEIRVQDSGKGFPPEFAPQLFKRFQQADATTTRAHGGLGLGLAIARHLVELHGGYIEGSSAGKGAGATFTVWLPRITPAAPAVAPPARAEARGASSGEIGTLEGVRVLVIDDEADTRELIATVLSYSKAQVRTAGSVASGLAAYDEERPDIVLCDLAMPAEDGFALLRALAARPGEQPPVLALTAHAADDDRRRALGAGFWAHVPKPIAPRDLVRVVAQALGFSPTRRAGVVA